MAFDPKLQVGDEIDNTRLCEIFQCSPQGGMRRSLKTNTLVLITNGVESLYQDRVEGDVLHYTGMGQVGDQGLDVTQNKTLNESRQNGVDVHLFEVLEPQVYRYFGPVNLDSNPYSEKQPDVEGKPRQVWMFPLRLKHEVHKTPVPADKLIKLQVKREKKARALDPVEIRRRAELAPEKPGLRDVSSTQFQRNEYVATEARLRAKGICQLCNQSAPFNSEDGTPYLEVHHIVWLSMDGVDTLSNTVALCPNCHRKMHVINDAKDIKILQERLVTSVLG